MKAVVKRRWQGSGAAVPNNLPRYLTGFVGRSADMSSLKSLLARSRITTLTGPGGGGKSRLAAELGIACLDRWPGGVWWVELAQAYVFMSLLGRAPHFSGRGRQPLRHIGSVVWVLGRFDLVEKGSVDERITEQGDRR